MPKRTNNVIYTMQMIGTSLDH